MRSLGVENVVAIVSVTSYLVHGFPANNHNETTASITTGIKLIIRAVLFLIRNYRELLDLRDDVPILFFRERLQGLSMDLA